MEAKPEYPVTTRPMKEEDRSFVFSTWLKSYRQSEWARSMSNDTFFSYHKHIVEEILNKPGTAVNVLCGIDGDEDTLYGYVVAEKVADKYLVHFMYCKYSFRKMGLMSKLIQDLGYFSTERVNFITHLPRNYKTFQKKYNLEYNPYILQEIN